MLKFKNSVLTIFLLVSILFSSCSDRPFRKDGQSVFVDVENTGQKIEVRVLSPSILKIAKAKNDSLLAIPSLVAANSLYDSIYYEVSYKDGEVSIATDSLSLRVSLKTGQCIFYDSKGNILLREGEFDIRGTSVTQCFSLNKEEAIYGLGQHKIPYLNLRKQKIDLVQLNTVVSNPVILSVRGYGLYWDNYSKSLFDDTGESTRFSSKVADKIQYFFIKGRNFDSIISGYRHLTGKVPMLPKWAFGYIQSRNRYKNRKQLMDVVRKQRKLGIPLDAIILDYYHWGDHGFGSMVFDKEDFPNAMDMIEELHSKYHCKLIVSVWPTFNKVADNWKLFNDRDFLLYKFFDFGYVYDAFNPEAGKLYAGLVKKNYLDKGVDAIWFDATEPEQISNHGNVECHFGKLDKYSNLYSYFDMKNVFQNYAGGNKRPIVLTRSAFAGQQQFGSIIWSGDIKTTFKSLAQQIPSGLNFCMTGIPYWNTDIGGYLGGDPNNQDYRELFVRWFQYGSFTPFFRAHGRREPINTRSGENELWSYGKQAQKILTKYVELRYRLLPYTYTMSHKVSSDGYTLMRALPFDFLYDKNVYNINDEFMFGNDILVCPVVKANALNRKVYLPSNTYWYDFWTNGKFNGGETVVADAPIEKIPLFVRAGSIIPIYATVRDYANDKSSEDMEIRVYSGADGTFSLYEDEGVNCNYKDGKYSEIKMVYIDCEKSFTLMPRDGSFPGMARKRNVFVSYVDGSGSAPIVKKILYSGNKVNVRF